jgi:hypothetical protein
MNREYSQDKTAEKELSENLRFMRSAAEKSYRKIKPATHLHIMWGLIFIASYFSTYFLAQHGLQKWITISYVSLISFGVFCNLITALICILRQKKAGFVQQLPWQLGGISLVIILPIFLWDMLGVFKEIFCQVGFIYAMAISIMVGIIGILYAKEWIGGCLLITAGMLLAFLAKEYISPFIILGLSTGAGAIIPAIISDIKFRKWEKEHERI